MLDISSAVPEPGSIGLLALGGVTLLRRQALKAAVEALIKSMAEQRS